MSNVENTNNSSDLSEFFSALSKEKKEGISSRKILEKRLVLLKKYYKTDIGFEYIVIPLGTKVIVKIPYTFSHE